MWLYKFFSNFFIILWLLTLLNYFKTFVTVYLFPQVFLHFYKIYYFKIMFQVILRILHTLVIILQFLLYIFVSSIAVFKIFLYNSIDDSCFNSFEGWTAFLRNIAANVPVSSNFADFVLFLYKLTKFLSFLSNFADFVLVLYYFADLPPRLPSFAVLLQI